MEKELAQKILEEDAEYELYEDYSGRGMFGNTTTAIVVPNRQDVRFLKEDYPELKSDNLGLKYILY